MPIKIPDSLPASKILEQENVFVMTEKRAMHQDIRSLRIVILNLMPKKIETETQLLRLLGNSPIQVDIDLMQTGTHIPKNTPHEHLFKFYNTFDQIKDKRYDGLIITGAPIEHLPFESVEYWEELRAVMEWSKTHVYSTFYICWGAQAGLYYHYGIDKYPLSEKLSGIFKHHLLLENHPITRGFDELFDAPHSRYTGIREEDVASHKDLKIIAASDRAGIYLIEGWGGRRFFVTGHSEYDRETLANEYQRDIDKGIDIKLPENYFPQNNCSNKPLYTWRSHANLLFTNWLNYVYQETPYNLDDLQTYAE